MDGEESSPESANTVPHDSADGSSEPEHPGRAGQLILGRYRLTRRLGQGGMGAVWEAENLSLGSPVAIKLMNAAYATTAEARARFMREAQAAAALRSPHVVQTFEHGMDGSMPFIAMEMLDGESLGDRLDRAGRLAPGTVASIMVQVARAMAKAHEMGIVHRDLKPDNIFLVHNDDELLVKVLDFGIAKATGVKLGDGTDTATGAMLGTPYYMSPEQAQGIKEIDFRSDLWAMAVITYQCLIGKRPFESTAMGDLLLKICTQPPPVPSEQGDVPPGFDAWFLKATEKQPTARHASAKELADELRDVLGGADASSLTSVDSDVRSDGAYDRTVDASTGNSTTTSGLAAHGADKGGSSRVPVGLLLGAAAVIGVALLVATTREPGSGAAEDVPTASPEPAAVIEPAPDPTPAASAEPTAAPAVEPVTVASVAAEPSAASETDTPDPTTAPTSAPAAPRPARAPRATPRPAPKPAVEKKAAFDPLKQQF